MHSGIACTYVRHIPTRNTVRDGLEGLEILRMLRVMKTQGSQCSYPRSRSIPPHRAVQNYPRMSEQPSSPPPFLVQQGDKNLDIAELAAASGVVVANRTHRSCTPSVPGKAPHKIPTIVNKKRQRRTNLLVLVPFDRI